MQLAEPIASSWQARLALEFSVRDRKTVLSGRQHDGPLVVQKPFYPEGPDTCHAIVVHPPGGIAGGDELEIGVRAAEGSAALLTTPGAAKWYRSAGAVARQSVKLESSGALEWLPQETIVFDGARAELDFEVALYGDATFIGWDIVCLGRTGSGERFSRGSYRFASRLRRDGRLLWHESGRIHGGGRVLEAPAGLGGNPVFGTMVASAPEVENGDIAALRALAPRSGRGAVTRLPGVLIARYLGASTEAAHRYFVSLWRRIRPALAGREAAEPRIWST